MRTEYADTKAVSRLFSWNWISSDFKKGWEYLNSTSASAGEKPIWDSGFTDVRLLEVPSETGTPFRIAYKTYREKRFFRYFLRPLLLPVKQKVLPLPLHLIFPSSRCWLSEKNAFF